MRGNALAGALVALAAASTAFEGGGSPDGILLVHALTAAAVLVALLAPPPVSGLGASTRAWLAVFAAAVLVSACFAPYGFAALLVVQDVAVGIAVLVLAARAPAAAGFPARAVLLAVAAVQGVLAMVQAAGASVRPAGTFLNPNHLAAWCGAAVLACAPPLLARGGRWRAVAVGLGALALGGAVAARSRGAALGFLTGAAVLLVLRWRSLTPRARRVALAGAGAAVLMAGGLFAWRLREDDPYRWTRVRIWSATLEVARSSPLLGTGPGQFATAAAGVRFQDPVGPLHWERRFSTPHSDLLRVPAEFGLPAALAALCALGACLRRSRAGKGLAAASSLAALAALCAQAVVDDLTTRPAIVVLGALLLGSLASVEIVPRAPLPLPGRAVLAGVVLVAFTAGDLAPWLAWRTLSGTPRAHDRPEVLRRALALNPVHPDTHLRVAETVLRGAPMEPGDYAVARREAETAVRLSPEDARYRVGLARVEAAACRSLFPDEATRARAVGHYAAAARLSPHDTAIPLEEARFLLATGDRAGAERAARRALDLEPASIPPRLLLAAALLQRNDAGSKAEARARVEEAESLAHGYASHPKESAYARFLLSADASDLGALRRALP